LKSRNKTSLFFTKFRGTSKMKIIEKSRDTGKLQGILEEELLNLKLKTGLNLDLEVLWVPDKSSDKSGEIKGNIIFIYEEEPEKALRTLKHEFIEYLLNRYSSLHKKVINKLLELIEEILYREKEKLIEALINLMD